MTTPTESHSAASVGEGQGLPTGDLWRTLLSPNRRAVEEKRALERLLVAWSDAHGKADAAVYAGDDDEGLLCRAKVGDAVFPVRLADAHDGSDDDASSGWKRLELPGAVLLHTAQLDPDLDRPTSSTHLLLAASMLISQLKRQIQEQSFQAMFRGVEQESLYEVGLAIASTLGHEGLGEEVLLRAISLLDARRGALYLLDQTEGVYRLSSSLGGSARDDFGAGELCSQSLAQGDGADGVPEDLVPGAHHILAVPVEIDSDPRGLLLVADKESRSGVGPFPSGDRRTLSLFANQAAIALENAKLHKLALEKERLEREMELAAEIQQQLLPDDMPDIPGCTVQGWNRPARQVGGDYFGFQELDEGRWCLLVGDVTGKGMPASLLVSTLHSALSVLLDHIEVDAELVQRLNRHVCESSASNKFITMLLAAVDPNTGHLDFINAGHNPGILLRDDGSVDELGTGGLPLGLLPMAQYKSFDLDVQPGDLLCLYSDGITECEAPDEEQYGMDRLVDLLREHREEPLPRIIEVIDEAMLSWAQGQPQGDDQTVVLLRREAGT
ncbi:MAG: SpoIIE family protein phosphatase [Thermoanaerobaculia bacterium]|nr:SpoIIE family protein phosphatase [Thermoanaerobaculia bacterium]